MDFGFRGKTFWLQRKDNHKPLESRSLPGVDFLCVDGVLMISVTFPASPSMPRMLTLLARRPSSHRMGLFLIYKEARLPPNPLLCNQIDQPSSSSICLPSRFFTSRLCGRNEMVTKSPIDNKGVRPACDQSDDTFIGIRQRLASA